MYVSQEIAFSAHTDWTLLTFLKTERDQDVRVLSKV